MKATEIAMQWLWQLVVFSIKDNETSNNYQVFEGHFKEA